MHHSLAVFTTRIPASSSDVYLQTTRLIGTFPTFFPVICGDFQLYLSVQLSGTDLSYSPPFHAQTLVIKMSLKLELRVERMPFHLEPGLYFFSASSNMHAAQRLSH